MWSFPPYLGSGCPIESSPLTAGAVDLVRAGKARGVRVTAEATPTISLSRTTAVQGYDTNTKMKPPLRRSVDREAVLEGLKTGRSMPWRPISPIARREGRGVDSAPFGIVGLETSVSLGLDGSWHRS